MRIQNLANAMILLFAVPVIVLLSPRAWSQSPEIQNDIRVSNGLRQRRMFELAEQLCRDQLANPEISPTDEVALNLELIRTHVARAIVATGTTRDAAWQAANDIADEFLSMNGTHPRRILVEVQKALTHQTRGSLIAQEILADIQDASNRENALAELRKSVTQFRQIEKAVERMLPEQRSKSLTEHDLTPEQLLNLMRNVRYQQAKSNLIKAELFPPDDRLNRVDTLGQVLKRLKEVLNQTNPEEPLWWQAQLNRAKGMRLSGDASGAAVTLAQLPIEQLPKNLAAELIEQQIENLIASNRLQSAGSVLQQAAVIQPIPPRLHLAILRLYLAMASQSSDAQQQQRWQNEAARLTQTIEMAHGGYWGRRAELLLIGPATPQTTATTEPPAATGNLEITLRVGDQAMRKERFEDAVKAYQRGIQLAESQGNAKRALFACVKLSEAFEKLTRHDQAAQTLIDAGLKYSNDPIAAAVHLRGCWNLSRVAKLDSSQQDAYAAKLAEHFQRWPDSSTADRARSWLARLQQFRQEYATAIQTYLEISPDSPLMADAARQIVTCFNALTQDPEKNDGDSAQLAETIVRTALRKLGFEPPTDQVVTDSGRELLLSCANIALATDAFDADQIADFLQTQIDAATDNQLAWKQRARCWQLVALAASNHSQQQTTQLLESLPNDPQLMAICAQGLDRAAKRASARSQQIAELQLMAADKALAALADEPFNAYWEAQRARALQNMGNQKQAVDLLRKLVAENPKSLDIQLRLGRALSETQPNSLDTLKQWRIIASRVKPQSDAWYEAKLQVARSLTNTDQSQQALDFLNYLQAVPPGWEQSKLARDFEKLKRELQSKQRN